MICIGDDIIFIWQHFLSKIDDIDNDISRAEDRRTVQSTELLTIEISPGCPAIATSVWFYLKMSVSHPASLASDDGFDGINIQRLLSYCPIYKEDNIDLYSYDLLVLGLLIVNSFFLFWIMGVSSRNLILLSLNFNPQIVLSKLRSQTAMDHDRRHLKAAKALVIVIPLFGFTYILTFIGPDEVSKVQH